MTALSATEGTGNIAGVATAVFLGGPGALFWMWLTALVGMATKYSEAVLAVRFREVDERGNHVGGPMYYIRNGLGSKWAWLGVLFAVFASIAAFGIGNTVQANSVADVLATNFNLPHWVTGVILMVLVGMVLIGGIKRIGQVASALVPFMAVSYVLIGLLPGHQRHQFRKRCHGVQLCLHRPRPRAGLPVLRSGLPSALVWPGVSSPTKPALLGPHRPRGSQNPNPVKQGMVAMLGTFIDTIIVCSITGLEIITSGAWTWRNRRGTDFPPLPGLPGGNYVVVIPSLRSPPSLAGSSTASAVLNSCSV